MFCPKCKDEFREGFTHCAGCNVDLVEDLSAATGSSSAGPGKSKATPAPNFPVRLAEFCGFLSLEEARHARDQLRLKKIRAEVVLREPFDASWDEPIQEEAWLRVEASRIKEVSAILDDDGSGSEPEGDGQFGCSKCGQMVAEEESFCPKCGARFEGE